MVSIVGDILWMIDNYTMFDTKVDISNAQAIELGRRTAGAIIEAAAIGYTLYSLGKAAADFIKGAAGENGLTNYGDKSQADLTKRGWTWDSAQAVVNKAYTTRPAVNKATGNPATAFYNQAGDYIVVDDITGGLVQASEFGNRSWFPDSTIINPYKPKP